MTLNRAQLASLLRMALPAISLAALLGAVFIRQPNAASYFGLTLLFNLAAPIALAAMAQMLVITLGDLDLSIGAFVSLVACIGASLLPAQPLLAIAALAACIALYAAVGALIEWRKLPSIVVTLGLSFVWLGLAILLLPSPGGAAPDWLKEMVRYKAPLAPLAIWAPLVIGLGAHFIVMRTAWGAVARGAGGNARAIERAGWPLMRIRASVYALAGVFGVLSGLMLVGLTTSGDANIASRYTLVSIASVILGGGEFTGGRVSPTGAVLGAMTLTLAASFLTFLNIPQDWQIGAQGVILILVLTLRAVIDRLGASA